MSIPPYSSHPPASPEEAPVAPEPGSTVPYDEPWLGSLLRPVLVVVLVTCIDVAILAFLRQYAPGLGDGLRSAILGLGVVAGIMGCATTTWLAHPNQRQRRTAWYRIAEIVLMLLVARVVVWAAEGRVPALENFLTHPDEVFFDGSYLVAALTVLLTWVAAIDFADDLVQLALQPDELHIARLSGRDVHDTTRPAQIDRASLLRQFVAHWVGWGLLLILLAATLRMGVTRDRFWTLARQDVDPIVVAVTVVYFLVGLLLISQGQLAVLRARWTIDRLPSSKTILHNWPFYAAAVIVIFGLIATFLPLGDTFLISTVLTAILNALYLLVSLIFNLISLLLIMLFSLLPTSGQRYDPAPPPPPMQQRTLPPALVTIPPWVGGLAFWATILGILVLAAYFYFSDKDASLGWLRRIGRLLRARWQNLWQGWHTWRAGQMPASTGIAREIDNAPSGWRWPLWRRALDPDQRVRYLYFQLLEQAEENDIPRRLAETPGAYAPRLSETVSAESEDDHAIHILTDAFVQVRYAGHNTEQEQASRLERLWQRLRKIFVS